MGGGGETEETDRQTNRDRCRVTIFRGKWEQVGWGTKQIISTVVSSSVR